MSFEKQIEDKGIGSEELAQQLARIERGMWKREGSGSTCIMRGKNIRGLKKASLLICH